MASFDGNGLVIDRLADIRTGIETDLRTTFGDGVDLDDDSPFGVLIGLISERYSLLYELLEAVYQASYPDTAFGTYLDQVCAYNAVIRQSATFSQVTLQFTRSNDINGGDVVIAAGTQCNAKGGSAIIWETTAEITILDGQLTGSGPAQASEEGAISALAGTIDTLVTTVANVDSVTNPEDAIEGSDEETDTELRTRRRIELGRSGTSTESGIRSALIALDEIRTATLIVNDTDAAVDDQPPHSIAPYVAREEGSNLTEIVEMVFDEPFVVGNTTTCYVDGNPLSGTVPFNTDNATTLADIAAKFATHELVSAAVADGIDRILIYGATSTSLGVIFASTGGGASQPNSSQTVIATASEENLNKVAQTLWDSKAAGIQTYGLLSATAIDDGGDEHTLHFSEIEEVKVWVRLTLTTTSEYDSATAEPAMRAALVEYATANLTAGVDVLNFKLLCAASDVGSAGITDIVCENSLDGVSFNAVNRPVGANEFATIDSSDVTFA